MEIKKIFLKETFNETLKMYSEKIYPINNVELEFISRETFMEGVKNNPLIEQQIKMGLYKNLEKEYPNFVVVYNANKNPLLEVMGLNYKISLCFEIAKEKLKPFAKNEVKDFLTYVFAHEITHILENKLKVKYPDLWEKCTIETLNNAYLTEEAFAEDVADMIANKNKHRYVENKLYEHIYSRIKK